MTPKQLVDHATALRTAQDAYRTILALRDYDAVTDAEEDALRSMQRRIEAICERLHAVIEAEVEQ